MSPKEDVAAVTLAQLKANSSFEAAVAFARDAPDLASEGSHAEKPKDSGHLKKQRLGRRLKAAPHHLARVVQVVNKPRGYMDHTYHDMSDVPPSPDEAGIPDDIAKMTFNQKVHHVLSQPEKYGSCIKWKTHGRAFSVTVPVAFERDVCPRYFGHKRYSSFLRQLNNHGYRHLSQGKDRNCYYHECMLLGKPHLLKYMPEPKDARRLFPDPENEPDFYAIDNDFPLVREPQLQFSGISLDMLSQRFLSAHVSTHEIMQPRLASEVSWLADSLPATKRLKYVEALNQNPTFNAVCQPLAPRVGVINIHGGPGIPPLLLPNTHGAISDLLLSSLIQQLGPIPQKPSPSSQISILDLLRQRHQLGYM